MTQPDVSNERLLWEKLQKGEGKDADAKSMDTDQYQHFIPRFILRKFAQPGSTSVTVWKWWDRRICVREIKNTFGMFNQYDSADNENTDKKYVEKLFADLECGMGAILKKVESSLAWSRDDTRTQTGLQLSDLEVNTVYKFIGLAGIRNGPLGLSCDPGVAYSTESSQGEFRKDWVKALEFLLKKSHKELTETDEFLHAEKFRPILASYKQLAMMKLFFWTTPTGEEFLLSNFLTGLEGYQYPEDNTPSKMIGVPAHVFVPISPATLLVLCSDSLCKKSMLHGVPHGVTIPYDRPARGKLGKTKGPKKYQPIVPNWKTIYPITQISADDLHSINGLILALGNAIVYKSGSTIVKAVDNITSFTQRHTAWQTANKGPNVKVEKEDESIAKILPLLLESAWMTRELLGRSFNDDLTEELMHYYETVCKTVFYAFDKDLNPCLLPLLCGSTAYYMGTRKAESRE